MSVARLPPPPGEPPTPSAAGCPSDDAAAFEGFFRQYHGRVSTLLSAFVTDRDLIDDLAQETLLRAYRRRLHWEPVANPWPWLATVARNLARDAVRHSAASREIVGEGIQVAPAREETPGRLSTLWGPPGVLEALHAVSAKQARILIARHLEGLGYGDIAAREEMSVEGVRSALFRARRAFRRRYEELADRRELGALAPGLWTRGRTHLRDLAAHLRRHATVSRPLDTVATAGTPGWAAGVVVGTITAVATILLPSAPPAVPSAAFPATTILEAAGSAPPDEVPVGAGVPGPSHAGVTDEPAVEASTAPEPPPPAPRRVGREIRSEAVVPIDSPAQSSASAESDAEGASLSYDREMDVDADGTVDDDGRLVASVDCAQERRRVVTRTICTVNDEAFGLRSR